MKHLGILLGVALLLGMAGCKKDKGDKGKADKKTMAAMSGPLAMVKVPAKGKKYAPPVQPSQIPAGAWYCDMGTVEYARMEKGDGKCPICMMRLKQKGAAAKKGAMGGHEHNHAGHMH